MESSEDVCKLDELVQRFTWPDYLVFVLMLLVSAAIGIYYGFFGSRQKTTSEFLVGNRQMGTFPMAMSLVASFMSAITLLGNPAEIYNFGTQFFMIVVAYILVTPVTAYAFLPVFYNLRLTTAYEYLAQRFNNCTRQLACGVFLCHMILYMPIVVYAPALALSQVTGINTYIAVSVIFIVCIFYTSVGGIKAVMWTDTFQVIVMVVSMTAVVIKGALDEGGFSEVWERSAQSGRIEFFNIDPDPRARHTVWSLSLGGLFIWASMYCANQTQIQRYLTVPSVRHARNALWWNCVGLTVLLILTCFAGLVIYAKYFDCDPISTGTIQASDQLFPLFVMDTLGGFPGIPGMFVAGIFSGALSTVSTGLNALAAITLKDFVFGCCNKTLTEDRATVLTKLVAVSYGVLSFALVFVVEHLGGILQVAYSIHGMVGGPILALFTLGMFFPWANSMGAISGTVVGLAFVFWIGLGTQAAVATGQIRVPRMPTSVEGCSCNFTMRPTPAPPSGDPFPLYTVSYMWYSAIGFGVTILIALLISFLTKPQDPRDLDTALLSPVAKWFYRHLPKSFRQRILCDFKEETDVHGDSPTEHKEHSNGIMLKSISTIPDQIPEKGLH